MPGLRSQVTALSEQLDSAVNTLQEQDDTIKADRVLLSSIAVELSLKLDAYNNSLNEDYEDPVQSRTRMDIPNMSNKEIIDYLSSAVATMHENTTSLREELENDEATGQIAAQALARMQAFAAKTRNAKKPRPDKPNNLSLPERSATPNGARNNVDNTGNGTNPKPLSVETTDNSKPPPTKVDPKNLGKDAGKHRTANSPGPKSPNGTKK